MAREYWEDEFLEDEEEQPDIMDLDPQRGQSDLDVLPEVQTGTTMSQEELLEEFEKIPLSEELVTKRNAIEKVDVKKLDSATQESIREINSELEKEGYLPIKKMFVPMWKLKRTKKQDSTTEVGDEISNDEYFYSILLSRYQVPEFKIQYGTVDNECYFTSDYNFHLPDFKESE